MSVNKFGKQKKFIEDCYVKDLPLDPIIRDAFIKIWEKLKSSIFIWDSFKTDLPFSTDNNANTTEYEIDAKAQHQKDLRAMCFDDNGRRKRLLKEQLAQIAKNGRFTVKSQINERFDNIWLLGPILQIGSDNISGRLTKRKERALRHWFLYLPEYFSASSQLSIIGGLKSFKNAISHLFRVILGMAEYRPRYSNRKISLLLNRDRIRHLIEHASPSEPNTNYWSVTQQQSLNLILADPDVTEKIKTIIQQLIEDLTEQGDTTDNALLLAVIKHPEVSDLDADLPELLKKFHHFYFKLSPLNSDYIQYYEAEVERHNQQLITQYPYRGRYQSWRKKQLAKKEDEIKKSVRRQLANDLLESLSDSENPSDLVNNLADKQEAYLLKQNIDFEEKHAEQRKNKLSLKMRLFRVFKFPVIRWSLKLLQPNEQLPVRKIKLATRIYGWRLSHMMILARVMVSNICLKLLRVWLLNPYGVKSVFTLSKKKFEGELWLQDNGKPYGVKKYATYLTALDEIKQNVKISREQFEERSDYGLFPRSVGRVFNRFYCYVMIGFLGSVFNLTFRALAFLLLSMFCFFGVFLAPIWVPVFSVLVFLFNVFIYDYIGPQPYYDGRRQKPYFAAVPLISTIIYFMLFRGLLVTMISLFGVLVHIIAVPIIYLLAIFSSVVRHLWDGFMRLIFIYPFARVPGDDFNGVITRIAGHGIAANILTTVNKEDGLHKHKLWLQVFILDIYESVVMKHLYANNHLLDEMMVDSYRAIVGDEIYAIKDRLRENINEYESHINKNIYGFRDGAHSTQNTYRSELIRLPQKELSAFVSESEIFCEHIVEQYLMPWLSDAEKKLFWLNLGINDNDWSLLNRVLLSQSFSADIFTPIEDCDDNISVMAEPVNIAKSLLVEKQSVSKLSFTVNQLALSPQTEKKLLFSDNDFWNVFYEPLYLPLNWHNGWQYLLWLRTKKLDLQQKT